MNAAALQEKEWKKNKKKNAAVSLWWSAGVQQGICRLKQDVINKNNISLPLQLRAVEAVISALS